MRWVARGSAVVLRVAGGELAVARSRMDQCAVALGGVHLDRGSQGVFGAAVLASAAAAFCSNCEDELRAGEARADGIVDGLGSAMRGFEAVDEQSAAGARALGGSLGAGAGRLQLGAAAGAAAGGTGWEGLR